MKIPYLFFINIFVLLSLSIYSVQLDTAYNVLNTEEKVEIIADDWIESDYNRYLPDANSSVLLALDVDLLGKGKEFPDESMAKQTVLSWLKPFEKKFNIKFHIGNVTMFDPSDNDSLDDSIQKVPDELSWKLASDIDDPNVQGNGYDWLLIYQYHYGAGHNQVNAIYGNALIIAHLQPLWWTSQQLILLHEVGHLFGARHDRDGNVSSTYWYDGIINYTIMDYNDLHELHVNGWDVNDLPIDDKNFDYINSSKYRFGSNDADSDGLPNYYEYRYSLNPNINDSYDDLDNDGLANIDEFDSGTDPSNTDSDKDGFSDWAESYVGTSPLNSSDVPIIDIPIVKPWTYDTTIQQKEEFILEWRSISSNPERYYIYQNGSEKFTESWENELIQFKTKISSLGIWNFTCLVIDQDGDSSRSIIWIKIIKGEKVPLNIFGSILGVFLITIIIRKKRKSIKNYIK